MYRILLDRFYNVAKDTNMRLAAGASAYNLVCAFVFVRVKKASITFRMEI